MSTSMEIVYQGWLTKSPPSRGIFRPRWRRRWFVLRTGTFPNQFVLEYFTDESARRQKGTINLDECEQLVGPLSVQERHKFTFQIRTPSRTYYLASDSETEMSKWVASLCQVCCLKTSEEDNHGNNGTIVYSRGGDENNEPNNVSNAQNNHQEEATESDDSSPTLSNRIHSGPYIPISECCLPGRSLPSKSEQNDVTYCNTSVFQFPPKVNWATHPVKRGSQSERTPTSASSNGDDGRVLLQTCVVAPPRPPKSKGCTAGVLVTVTSPEPSATTPTATEPVGTPTASPYDNEENPDSSSTCSSLHSPPGSAGAVYSNISDILPAEPRSAGVRGTLLGQYSPQGSKANSPTSPPMVSAVPPPVVDRNLKPLKRSGRKDTVDSNSTRNLSSGNHHGNDSSSPTQKVPTPSYSSGTQTLPSRSMYSNRFGAYVGPSIDRSRKPTDGHYGPLSLGPTPAQIKTLEQPHQNPTFSSFQYNRGKNTGTLPSSPHQRAGPMVSPHDRKLIYHEYEQAPDLKGTYLQIECQTNKDGDSPKFTTGGGKNTLGRKGFGIQSDASVEYRLIDPVKTRALNKTREDREKQLRNNTNTHTKNLTSN